MIPNGPLLLAASCLVVSVVSLPLAQRLHGCDGKLAWLRRGLTFLGCGGVIALVVIFVQCFLYLMHV